MLDHAGRRMLVAAGWAVFVLVFVLPAVGLAVGCLAEQVGPRDGFSVSPRQWGLLGRSVCLAALGTAAALLLSLPGAYVVGRVGRLSRGPWLIAMLIAPLLLPPMVYAFGWERLLPVGFSGFWRCVAVWALWSWPLPALLIGVGWSRSAGAAYSGALLSTSPAGAFFRVVLPSLVPHLIASAAILWVILLGEYSVPHACGLMVYATELLGWAQESVHPIDTLWPAMPLAGVVLLGLLLAVGAWRGAALGEDVVTPRVEQWRSRRLIGGAGALLAVSVGLPLAAFVVKSGSVEAMVLALRTHGYELGQSLALAGLAGLVIVGLGLSVAVGGRARGLVLVWSLVFGALPGALVGEAILSTYRPVTLVYDHWVMVVMGYVARFGWIGMLAMAVVERAAPDSVCGQAEADGADAAAVTLRIRAAMGWPVLVFAGCLAATLSLAELPASTLLRVPSVQLIAIILIEKFHRFEDGMLASLSLWLVLSAIPAVVFSVVALRSLRDEGGSDSPRGGAFDRPVF
ncbi:MAG: hypothetical protein GY842_18105 [bacterium]|nr:hypothetical protein [bacterium]